MSTSFRPQAGPQERFLSSPADIVVFGGAAGGGKSYALLLEAVRHFSNPLYRAVIFRRTYPQITAGGGLWDAAGKLYPRIGGTPNQSKHEYRFRRGSAIAFRHLQYETNVYDWQGAELAFIGFDELTHFTERQFFYLLSRNRSTCGVRPYVRATCNPDAGSWVAGFLSWWIDPDTGFPDPGRAGVVRWFYRDGDETHWYDSREAAEAARFDLAADAPPKSFTFVPAKLEDNPALVAADPGYRANLMALPYVERERLLAGNWKVTAADGMFRADWFRHGEPAAEVVWKRRVRAWDLAATEPKECNDPDYAVGVLMGQEKDTARRWVLDVQRVRVSPQKIQQLVKDIAARDGTAVDIVVEQEPGASGKIVAENFRQELKGYRVLVDRPDRRTGDKVTRAHGYSAAVERGEVRLAAGGWVRPFIAEHVQFPFGSHDDQVDAAATAFRTLMFNTGPAASRGT
jgi:predicted phage terminase large subunit-like protein